MNRLLRSATIAVTLAGIAMGPPANALNRQQELRQRQCRYQWLDPGTWTDREERRTAACVVDHFGVVGGLDTLIQFGDCESHWWRFANNGGSYLGIFQHAASYWPSRVRSAMPDGWKVGAWERWTNPRSQIVTTVRMVNGAGSWSAWSCA